MTREEALTGHRRLWNEIADMIERGNCHNSITKLKKRALKNIGETMELENDCYLCEYASDCKHCPVAWSPAKSHGTAAECEKRNAISGNSEWVNFKKAYYKLDYKAAAAIARKIADLPERVVE